MPAEDDYLTHSDIEGAKNIRVSLNQRAWINWGSLQSYGRTIYNHLMVGEYEFLRQYCLTPDGNFNEITRLHTICDNFIKNRENLHSSIITLKLINYGFCAYLKWMSKAKFEYQPDQAAPDSYQNIFENLRETPRENQHPLARTDSAYTVFWKLKKPTGNCTVVNSSFAFLLQMLGVHPKYLFLVSVATDDNSDAYVITKDMTQLTDMISRGQVNNEYAHHLHLPHYVSKTLSLKPNTCEVRASERETPFPNHQYLQINMPLPYNYYDARNGYRYLNPMGMFEFWKVTARIEYLTKDGSVNNAMIVERPTGQSNQGMRYTIEAPEICWPSIKALTKSSPNRNDVNSICWFYVDGNDTYGVKDTSVRLLGGKERLLPHTLASVYGFFIRDSEIRQLPVKIRKVLDEYEGRSFLGLRKPSQQSIQALRALRATVGGGKVDQKTLDKYYGGESANIKITNDSNIFLRDQLYAFLGSIQKAGITPLKRDSSLFHKLADALQMPDYLR